MTRENQVEKILDELEEEFAKANMPVNDKLTLFAKVSNAIYKYAEQESCTDAISREAAIKAICRYCTPEKPERCPTAEICHSYQELKALPPVQVKPDK